MKLKIMSASAVLLPSLLGTEAPIFAATDKQNIIRTIRTQEELNAYLEETGSDLGGDKITFELSESIVFPKKTFKIQNSETVWSFKGTGKPVTIDFGGSVFLQGVGGDFFWLGTGKHGDVSNNTVIKNGTFYGTTTTETSKEGRILDQARSPEKHGSIFGGSRHGLGMFMGQFLKASFLSFQNLTFNNVHHEDGHVFDLSGSDHITFYNNTFAGYGGRTFSDEEIRKRFNMNHHFLYSEAIQIDSAIKGTFGNFNPKGTILENVPFDGTPSSFLRFEKNSFTTYEGLDAEGLINNDQTRKVVRNYSAGLGSHTRGNGEYKNIIIKDNVFTNTINFKNNNHEERHLMYPIHFEGVSDLTKNKIFISGNIFQGIETKADSGKLIKGRIGVSENTVLNPEKPRVEIKESAFVTKYVEDSSQLVGSHAVIKHGVNGYEKVSTTFDIDPDTGKFIENKFVTDKKEQVEAVVAVGTKPKVMEIEIPYGIRYVADSEKAIGYRMITQKGHNGSEKRVTTYNLNELTGKVVENAPSIERVEPIDEIVTIGIKSTTVVREIPYATKYIEDDTKELGYKHTVQQGFPGYEKIITSYSLNNTTGAVIKNTQSAEKKEPVDEIIAIGTKSTEDDGIHKDTIAIGALSVKYIPNNKIVRENSINNKLSIVYKTN